jgi:hypothetical protein
MRYLITYTENEIQKVFYSDWFDVENNYNKNLDMVVIDLYTNKYFNSGMKWLDIVFDHL